MTLHFTHNNITEREKDALNLINICANDDIVTTNGQESIQNVLTEYSRKTERITELESEISRMKEAEEWISVDDKSIECGQYACAYYNPLSENKQLYVLTVWRGRNAWYWDNQENEKAEDGTMKITHYKKLNLTPPKQ